MGYKCKVLAVSPRIPREDIWAHPEGGPDAAAAAVRRFFPDHTATGDPTTAQEGFYPRDGNLYVGTWGDTVVFGLADPDVRPIAARLRAAAEPHEIVWMLNIHSTVDHCGFAADGPGYDRSLVAWSDADPDERDDFITGTPLPFEEPYTSGQHSTSDDPEEQADYPYPFHPLDLGNAAALWMFGVEAETPPSDAIVDALLPHKVEEGDLPMHRFAPPAAEPEPTQQPAPAKKSLFGRLFGRS